MIYFAKIWKVKEMINIKLYDRKKELISNVSVITVHWMVKNLTLDKNTKFVYILGRVKVKGPQKIESEWMNKDLFCYTYVYIYIYM